MSNLTIQELAHYLTGELGKYHLEEIAITTETRIHDCLGTSMFAKNAKMSKNSLQNG